MTVEELISLNQMIGDIEVEVREGGTKLVWIYRFGKNVGNVTPHMFGGERAEIRKKMTFSPKPINAKDMGKDYYQILVDKIPENVRKLEVCGFSVTKSYRGIMNNHNFEEIHITALPEAQMTIGAFMKGGTA